VEKPLALDEEELAAVREAAAVAPDLQLLVGFNRRFAPLAGEARRLLDGRREPVAIAITVNAGALPPDHWTRDPAVGGEGCHFVDLAAFLVGAPIERVCSLALGDAGAGRLAQSASIQLGFRDGSNASIQYLACGPWSFPKERVEIFSEGRALVIDNWRRLRPYGWPGARRRWTRQDKGHRAQIAAFLRAIERGDPPVVPFAEIASVMRATFAAADGTGAARDPEVFARPATVAPAGATVLPADVAREEAVALREVAG